MNRRDFIKSLGVVTAGSAATVAIPVVASVVLAEKPESKLEIQPIEFDHARLQRFVSGRWNLEFESGKLFNPSGQKEIVVEIEEFQFLLKGLGEITHSTSNLSRSKSYIHWLSGSEWETLSS